MPRTPPTCPRCGTALAEGTAACPRCLLELGLHDPQRSSSPVSSTAPALSLAEAPTLEMPLEDDVVLADERTPVRFAPGVELAPYRLVFLLGRGAFGEVWEAEDSRDQRRVALKLLTEDLGPRARERFRREGKIAAAIHHPRVVFLFTAEELDGVPALAMELLPGGTLQDLIRRRGPLPWKEAVARVRELIDGLEAAHRRGILHRDVKPSNCFLDEQGGVKIGDFGLSRATEGGDSFTRAGVYVGTPSFSSPEQVRGAKLDVRSDLFSLGATFYYLLTGQAPFGGENLGQVLASVLADSPRAIASYGIELPRGLERVVTRLLAKRPEERYRDYDALRAALMPYTESGLRPGDLLRRPAAFLADLAFLGLASTLVIWLMSFAGSSLRFEEYGRIGSPTVADHLLQVALELGYFFALELWLGASLGKALLGLAVRRADGSPLDTRTALRRAVGFVVLSTVPCELVDYVALSNWALDRGGSELVLSAQMVFWGLAALLFSRGLVATSMRRGNGYAGLHELFSQTRVVRALPRASRLAAAENRCEPTLALRPAPTGISTLGPYRLHGAIDLDDGNRILVGADPVLDRTVWILPNSGALANRPGGLWRLQVLTTAAGAWEAFAAPDGSALLAAQRSGELRSWREGRAILQGVAEIVAQAPSGARFSLSNFWVASDLRVLHLPFVAPGLAAAPGRVALAPGTGAESLHQAVLWLAQGTPPNAPGLRKGILPERPLPRADREIVTAIAEQDETSAAQIAARLGARRGAPGEISRAARFSALLFWVVPCAYFALESVVELLVTGGPPTKTLGVGEPSPFAATLLMPFLFLAVAALPALPLSVVFAEGGLTLRLARLAVARTDGSAAGALRRLVRSLVAWAPALLALAHLEWVFDLERRGQDTVLVLGLGADGSSAIQFLLWTSLLLVGAAYAVLHPQRGLQDRLAGTVLVPL